jgi:transketolase
MSLAYGEVLRDLGRRYPQVLVLDAGLATSMHTNLFCSQFPERYLNLGIAEQNAVGVASGLARRGFIPVLHSFSNFLARRAHDQVFVAAVWPSCNVKFVAGTCGVFDGHNGPSHLAFDDLAVMCALPGVTVVEPGDLTQMRELLSMIVDKPGPAYLRLRRFGLPGDLLGDASLEQGTVVVSKDPVAICTLVACGSLLAEGIQATRMLADRGIHVDLIHISILNPLNAEPVLESARRTGQVVTIENHSPVGGFGDAIARALGSLGVQLYRLSIPCEIIPAGDPEWLLSYCGLDAASVTQSVSAIVQRRSPHVSV